MSGPYSATRSSMPRPWSASAFSVSCSNRIRCWARNTSSRWTASVSFSSGPGGGQRVGRGVADLGVGLVVDGLVLGDGELLLGRLQREQGVGAAGLHTVAALLQPGGLGLGGTGGLLEQAEPGGASSPLLL